MSIEALKAAQAYAQAGNGGAGVAAEGAAKSDGPTFADLVKDAVDTTESTLEKGETQAIAALSDKADLVDVVTAVSTAEVTLETVVAVRDRMIGAYQEIMRMPI